QDIGNDGILGESVAVGQAAGHTGGQEPGLQRIAYLVLAIEHSKVAPHKAMFGAVATDIVQYPRGLAVVAAERECRHVPRRFPRRLGVISRCCKQWWVARHQQAAECEDLARTPKIVLEMNDRVARDLKVVHEVDEHARISAGPGVDRLFVVANREDVSVAARELAYHRV